jgi:hypothetical protein
LDNSKCGERRSETEGGEKHNRQAKLQGHLDDVWHHQTADALQGEVKDDVMSVDDLKDDSAAAQGIEPPLGRSVLDTDPQTDQPGPNERVAAPNGDRQSMLKAARREKERAEL